MSHGADQERISVLNVSDKYAYREITLNRPAQHNGLDFTTGRRLLEAVVDASRDPGVRAILVSGAGPSFCSGDDITTLRDHLAGNRTTAPADPQVEDAHYIRICEEILVTTKPVVMALQGSVYGAGLEIACAADLRIGDTTTRFCCPLARLGHVGSTAMLQRVVGSARATSWYLTSHVASATEGLQVGLLDEIAPEGSALVRARAVTQELAQGPTKAFALFKELRERTEHMSCLGALRLQDHFHYRSRQEVQDSHEGPLAFLEKRTPRFLGR